MQCALPRQILNVDTRSLLGGIMMRSSARKQNTYRYNRKGRCDLDINIIHV